MISKPHFEALAKLSESAGNEGFNIGGTFRLEFYLSPNYDREQLQEIAEGEIPMDQVKRNLAQFLRDYIDTLDDQSLAECIVATEPEDSAAALRDQGTELPLMDVLEQALEEAGVEISQAQEEEIEGMWDWQHPDSGQACSASLNTKLEALLDAAKTLGIDAGPHVAAAIEREQAAVRALQSHGA